MADADAAKKRSIFTRLYHGETEIDFIGRTRLWFIISTVVIIVGVVSLITQGLNFGIDFKGGVVWELPANGVSVEEARSVVEDEGLADAKVQTLTSDEGVRLRVQSEPLDDTQAERERETKVAEALAEITGGDVDEVSINSVGPSWGSEISRKAARALAFFLIAITIYITFRFEFKMAMPTLAALVHDILVTVGVYSLAGFPVTPATVIALLTILGYSIYDGIVVFDKVDENTKLVSSAGRMTYGDMVNLSLNQVLMRSLNTSLTALLPITSLLIIGSFVLGATTLEEFALALLVGLLSGAYSSIFIASPMLAILKEREPRYRDLRRRIETRAGRGAPTSPAAAAAAGMVGTDPDDAGEREPVAATAAKAGARKAGAGPAYSANHPPRPRKKKRR